MFSLGVRKWYGWLCVGPYNFTWWFCKGFHYNLIDKRKLET